MGVESPPKPGAGAGVEGFAAGGTPNPRLGVPPPPPPPAYAAPGVCWAPPRKGAAEAGPATASATHEATS